MRPAQSTERVDGLRGHDAVTEGGELFGQREPEVGIGGPALRQAHEPFHEARRGPVLAVVVQEGG